MAHSPSPRILEATLLWGDAPQSSELVEGDLWLGKDDSPFSFPNAASDAPFRLVEQLDGAWVLRVPEHATGFVSNSEIVTELEQLTRDRDGVRTMLLGEKSFARVEFGAFSLHLAFANRPEKTPRAAMIDWTSQRFIVGSFLVHSVILGILFLSPPYAAAMSHDVNFVEQRRLLTAATIPLETPPPEEEEPAALDGATAAGEAGRVGDRNARRERAGGGVQVRGESQDRRVPLTRETVMDTGALGALRAISRTISTVTSDSGYDMAAGFAAVDAYSATAGGEPGIEFGYNGLALNGTRSGGGCVGSDCAPGTIGVGRLGTSGGPGGTCGQEQFDTLVRDRGLEFARQACSGTNPHARLGARAARRPPGPRPGVPEIAGGLSRDEIRRTIQRRLPEVRHCYEQVLQQRPDLAGRINVGFVIGPDGRVMTSGVLENELTGTNVGECVARAVQRWSFPSSPGTTSVRYPFVFEAGTE